MARGQSAGAVRVDIVASSASFRKAIQESRTRLQRFVAATRRMARNIKNNWKLVAAAVAGVATGIGVAVKKMTDYSSTLVEASRQTGLTVKELEGLRTLFEGDGIGIKRTDKAMQEFNVRIGFAQRGIGQYTRAFEEMGISLRGQDGAFKSQSDLLSEVAKALSETGSESRAASLAYELFGRSGKELLPILRQYADGIDKAAEASNRFNTLTDAQHEANKALGQSFLEWRKSAVDLLYRVLAQLAPTLKTVFDRWTDWMQNLKDSPAVMSRVANAVLFVVRRIEDFVNTMSWLLTVINAAARFAKAGLITADNMKDQISVIETAQMIHDKDSLRYLELDVQKYETNLSSIERRMESLRESFELPSPDDAMQGHDFAVEATTEYKNLAESLDIYSIALEKAKKRLEEFKAEHQVPVPDEDSPDPTKNIYKSRYSGLTDGMIQLLYNTMGPDIEPTPTPTSTTEYRDYLKALRTRGGRAGRLDAMIARSPRDENDRVIWRLQRYLDGINQGNIDRLRNRYSYYPRMFSEFKDARYPVDLNQTGAYIGMFKDGAPITSAYRRSMSRGAGLSVVKRSAFMDSYGSDGVDVTEANWRRASMNRNKEKQWHAQVADFRRADQDSVKKLYEYQNQEELKWQAQRTAFREVDAKSVEDLIELRNLADKKREVQIQRMREVDQKSVENQISGDPWRAKELRDQRDIDTGVRRVQKAMEEYNKQLDKGKDKTDQMADALLKWGENMVQNFTNLRDALENLLTEIGMLLMRQFVTQPLANAASGWLGSIFDAGGNDPYSVFGAGKGSSVDFGAIGTSAAEGWGGRGVTINYQINSTDGPGVRSALAEATPGIINAAEAQISDNATRYGNTRNMIRGRA